MYKKTHRLLALTTLLLASNTWADHDPYESFNRPIDQFNGHFDQAIYKPIAQGYTTITPNPAQQAVHNFVDNIFEPETIINDLLQGKMTALIQDSARFIFNSTFGLFGLIDIATPMGLPRRHEDLGQTLAVWGWKESDYLTLPFLGPSTVRDVGVKPIEFIYLAGYGLPITLLKLLDIRATLLPLDPMLEAASDRYLFIRNSYLQQRNYLINDGVTNNQKKLNEFDFSD